MRELKRGDMVTIRGRVVMALDNGVWIEGKSTYDYSGRVSFPPVWFTRDEIVDDGEAAPEQEPLFEEEDESDKAQDFYELNGLR